MVILLFFCSMLLQEKPQQRQVRKHQVFHQVRLKATRGKIRKDHLFQIILLVFLVVYYGMFSQVYVCHLLFCVATEENTALPNEETTAVSPGKTLFVTDQFFRLICYGRLKKVYASLFCSMLLQEKPLQHQVKKQLFHQVRIQLTEWSSRRKDY